MRELYSEGLSGEVIFKLDQSGNKLYMKNYKRLGLGKGIEVVGYTYSKKEAGLFLEGTKELLEEVLYNLNCDGKYLWRTEEEPNAINEKGDLKFEDKVILAAADYMTREFSEEDDDLEEYRISMVELTKDYVKKGENIPIATGYVDEPYCHLDAFIDIKNKSIFQEITPFDDNVDDESIILTLFQGETEEALLSEISKIFFEAMAMADEDRVQELLDERNAKSKGFTR
ncbi:hypothetical protein FYN86_12720 [Listeria monocytogenes]|uniref:hypothetical protein n=1 Tax=Listeria monocytogenes TaxID=1639 RepID=UPI0010B85950|nr:hypothetical protein [Listeria monocytogenes]EAF4467794.1 hypothetical protein [Listeria monocytogenes serotype 1/2a]EAC2786862.1 hypothetical protein [Listeria monocytogenes]EAD1931351.1 hypothetical protein [Listeria monocytogenes]EAD3056176.1 hypothetical protein [Listeria monocytogenes]EAD7589487.1 hypothetical protein [Listeria monocytogenes]